MAIQTTDLLYKYTGASSHDAAQASAAASLGNYRASSLITSGADNNLFEDVSGADAAAGATHYRAIAFHNAHGTLPLTAAVTWISVDTGNGEDDISFAVEAPANEVNGTIQTIANEDTAPATVSFSDATSKATGEACPNGSGEVGAGEWFGIWVRRIISAAASAADAEAVTLRTEGETAA